MLPATNNFFWTKYTQCRHSVKTRAQLCEILTVSPYCFWHPTFFSKWNSLCFFLWALIDLLYVLSYGFKLPINFLWEWGFFQISSIKGSKLYWICYDWYLSILISNILSTLSYWSSKISVNSYFILLVVEKIYPLSCPIFRHQLLRLVPW